jgi:hypothetical protein
MNEKVVCLFLGPFHIIRSREESMADGGREVLTKGALLVAIKFTFVVFLVTTLYLMVSTSASVRQV